MKEATFPVSEFKAKCLRLLEEVAREGKSLTITKHGRPIARVSPAAASSATSLRGTWKDTVRVHGDIVHFTTAGEWESGQ